MEKGHKLTKELARKTQRLAFRLDAVTVALKHAVTPSVIGKLTMAYTTLRIQQCRLWDEILKKLELPDKEPEDGRYSIFMRGTSVYVIWKEARQGSPENTLELSLVPEKNITGMSRNVERDLC